MFVHRSQDLCIVRGTSQESPRGLAGQYITLLEVRRVTECPFLVVTVILGFLSIFNKSQTLSPFKALNSACLLMCEREVRPPVQRRQGPRSFSRFSTGDSDIPSSCEMKDEPAFKPLQGNPSFFRVRVSRGPFNLRKQTQCPCRRPIA